MIERYSMRRNRDAVKNNVYRALRLWTDTPCRACKGTIKNNSLKATTRDLSFAAVTHPGLQLVILRRNSTSRVADIPIAVWDRLDASILKQL